MKSEYKNHEISIDTDCDGTWVYSIKGPVLNSIKTFSRISSSNKTIEDWKAAIDKEVANEI